MKTLEQVRSEYQVPDGFIIIRKPSKKIVPELTQSRLKGLLSYDGQAGSFTWIVNRIRVRPGDKAGKIGREGYVVIRIEGREYRAHRLAWLYMTGNWPTDYVDHMNGDRGDNRWANLRLATNSQNQMNTSAKSNNTSGYKGVSWHKRDRLWRADIRIDGKKKSLGFYHTPEEAHLSYAEAAKESHGEFARVS